MCWRDDDHAALVAALICGESFYSIGKRFKLSAMSVSRHWDRDLAIDPAWRRRSKDYGPQAIRKQLVREAPFAAKEIAAWLRGDRPTAKVEPAPDLRPLRALRRQRLALSRRMN